MNEFYIMLLPPYILIKNLVNDIPKRGLREKSRSEKALKDVSFQELFFDLLFWTDQRFRTWTNTNKTCCCPTITRNSP